MWYFTLFFGRIPQGDTPPISTRRFPIFSEEEGALFVRGVVK